jgi:hypothetical protein
MRYLFIGVFIVLVVSANAQEVVKISPAVAKFFLEQSDRADVLAKKDSLNEAIIENLTYTVSTKDLAIQSLKSANKSLIQISKLKDQQIQLSEEEIKHLKKQVRKEKIKTAVVAVASTVLIILI